MERFQEWLPEYATTFRNISENVCSETLRAYQYLPPGNDKLNTCYHHIDCIVANLTETRKANMASASVLLGLMPSLVASLAPSIAEITLLSLDHPVLSLLTSLAVPSVYPSRVSQYDDPFLVLTQFAQPGVLDIVISRLGFAIHLISYTVCFGSIANIWSAVIYLCDRTVLSWGCLNWYMPIVWISSPVVIHLVSAIPFRVAFNVYRLQGGLISKVLKIESLPRRVRQVSQAREKAPVPVDCNQRPWFVVLTNCAAGIGAFIHLALGIYIFSSLLFIPANDALTIIARFVLSAFACRMVTVLEIAHMSGLRRHRES